MTPTIVIGGGHNGLTAAAWLAKAGQRVIVLEARCVLGGLAARETFAPGYSLPGVLHDTRGVRPAVVEALGLERHGLSFSLEPRPIAIPLGDGAMWLHGDRLEGAGAKDTANFCAWREFLARVRPAIARVIDRPAPDPAGELWPLLDAAIRVRRLGADDMLELMRVMPMCVGDWMRDSFESERLMAALALTAVEASFTGPWSAGTAANLLLREVIASRAIEGGPAALVAALEKAARAYGVEIRTEARVTRIVVKRGRVIGVELADGEGIACDRVLSSCDPKQTLLELVGEQRLSARFANDIRNVRTRGTTAVVRLGLSGPLELDGKEVTHLRTGDSLDAIERAYDAAKYRRVAEKPVLDVITYAGPEFAPAGHVAASLLVHAAAFDRPGGYDERARSELGDAAVTELARHIPEVAGRIVAREVLTPVDLAERYRLTGGHLHHGEHALDQLLFMRPTVECAGYATPIAGLFLGGSGCHPGGGLTCAPGALAAQAILR